MLEYGVKLIQTLIGLEHIMFLGEAGIVIFSDSGIVNCQILVSEIQDSIEPGFGN